MEHAPFQADTHGTPVPEQVMKSVQGMLQKDPPVDVPRGAAPPAGSDDVPATTLAAGKQDLNARVEGLSQDAPKIGGDPSLAVPSHEAFTATATTAAQEAFPGAALQQPARSPRQTHQSFEERTYVMARGAETPDGPVQALHLHHQEGDSHEGAPLSGRTQPFAPPAHGGGATPSSKDHPTKLMPHKTRKSDTAEDVAGATAPPAAAATAAAAAPTATAAGGAVPEVLADIAAPEGDTESGGASSGVTRATGEHAAPGGATAGANSPKDFVTSTNQMARGVETPDGPLQALHLHEEHDDEGRGSRADAQLGELLSAPHQPPKGAHAPQDAPNKMMPHHREEVGQASRTAHSAGLEGSSPTTTEHKSGGCSYGGMGGLPRDMGGITPAASGGDVGAGMGGRTKGAAGSGGAPEGMGAGGGMGEGGTGTVGMGGRTKGPAGDEE